MNVKWAARRPKPGQPPRPLRVCPPGPSGLDYRFARSRARSRRSRRGQTAAEINPSATAALPQANQSAPRPAAAKTQSTETKSGDSPSIRIDPGLLARIAEDSALQGLDQNLDAEGARSLAQETQQQLASQTLSIANQSPQTLQGLFR